MALSELPVPKKGELTRIGQLKKRKVRIKSYFITGYETLILG
jgi:hypothetical protein